MLHKLIAAVGMKAADQQMTSQDYEFMRYVSEYGKSYGTKSEFEFRSAQFKDTLAHIEEHNSKNGETHTLGLNHMSDWTEEEYKKLLGYKQELRTEAKVSNAEELDTSNLADDVNWVTKGAVTPVKNQGQCGSCWAFSSTGSIEGSEFLYGTKMLTSLSEQNLVDCSKKNDACKGGLMDYAFAYVEENPLMTEAEYPYTGHHSLFSKCKYEKSKGVGHVKGFKDVTSKNLDQMKAALALGPVSVAIEADKSVFQSYRSGVITSAACGQKLDHGVLAVGYGVSDDGQEYILVKNSWGPTWGDEGYIKIASTEGKGTCGINEMATRPSSN
jgi:C1A family cysteine protease